MPSTIRLQNPSYPPKTSHHFRRYFLFSLIIILLAVGFLSSFWISGNLFYHRYKILIKAINDKNPSYPIKIIHYKKGWFHSYATLLVPIQVSFLKNGGLYLDQVISHGPWIYNPIDNTHMFALGAVQSTLSFSENGIKEKNISTFSSVFTFHNEYLNHFEILPMDFSLGNNFIKWQGLSGNNNLMLEKNQLARVVFELSSTPCSVKMGEHVINIGSITAKIDMRLNAIGLFDGLQELSIAELDFMQNDEKFAINHFNLNSNNFTVTPNYYNYNSQLNIAQVTTPALVMGPIVANFSISNLDAEKIKSLSSHVNIFDIQQSTSPPAEYETYLLSAMTPNTQINFDYANDTTFGKILLNSKIDFPPNVPIPQTFDELRNIVRMHASLIAPIALVKHFLMLHVDKVQSEQNANMVAMQQPSEAALQNRLDQLEIDGIISTSAKTQISNILSTKPTTETFSNYLDQLVTMNSIPPDIADALKKQFKEISQFEKQQLASGQTIQQPNLNEESSSPSDMVDAMIKQYKESGFIVENGDNYVTTIDINHGSLTVNGKVMAQQNSTWQSLFPTENLFAMN